MDKRLEPFLSSDFSAVQATRAFFSEHAEADIPRELSDLAALQVCLYIYIYVYICRDDGKVDRSRSISVC
jgi:hypothetical protein